MIDLTNGGVWMKHDRSCNTCLVNIIFLACYVLMPLVFLLSEFEAHKLTRSPTGENQIVGNGSTTKFSQN